MEVRVSNLGIDEDQRYTTKYDWPCYCQAGNNGVVIGKKGNYTTAFFEAFPNNPGCFVRGEGENLVEAEQAAWDKFQKILTCDHEMDRKGRTDGYAYCTKCSYAATVFEPLTRCCKCGKHTAYASDYKGRYYCESHSRNMPNNPDRNSYDHRYRIKRTPRKRKKRIKRAATALFRHNGYNGKVKFRNSIYPICTCDDMQIAPFGRKNVNGMIGRGEVLIKEFGKKISY